MGVHVKQEDISINHRLRPTKNVKDRVIVKFIATTKREEVYKKRLALRSKTAKDLPSITVFLSLPSSTVIQNAKIYVNESLTPYCKRLFSDILKSKREYSYNHLWTSNGKICLWEFDTSPTYSFISYEHFNEFGDKVSKPESDSTYDKIYLGRVKCQHVVCRFKWLQSVT